jgi:hypothetical protein
MEIEMTQQTYETTTKSGRGSRHGVVSEVSAFLHIKPGEVEELRAAIGRFQARLRNAPREYMVKFGLVDMRHVIFDNDTRLCWITAFDTDWDPYIDDSVNTLGLHTWIDWAQHTVEYDPEVLTGPAGVKVWIQGAQIPADGFFRAVPDMTLGEVTKAERVRAAFDQVLDDPRAAEVLQNPVLKPLLEEAAD